MYQKPAMLTIVPKSNLDFVEKTMIMIIKKVLMMSLIFLKTTTIMMTKMIKKALTTNLMRMVTWNQSHIDNHQDDGFDRQ